MFDKILSPGGLDSGQKMPLPDAKQPYAFPKVYVIPGYNVFANMERARFAKALASRIPLIEAQISIVDAEHHKLSANFNIIVETKSGKYAMRAKTSNLPSGVIVLPFGLIDPAVFYDHAVVRLVNEECV